MTDNLSGQKIRGYELRERIGTGGFGAVYSAFQPTVGREVAIKVILPAYANHPEFIRRFEYEAQLVARLEHPFIIPLYDYWREPNSAYLVMRFLRGGNLATYLERNALPLPATVRLFDQICTALAIAHRAGIVHRDLKPANILLDNDENAYLADFGIAKDILPHKDGKPGDEGVSADDVLVGSPAYLSPEQILNEKITPQTDIYALGIVLYETVTGLHPYPGNLTVMELLRKQLHDSLPSIRQKNPDLPPALDEVIGRATAKRARERYTNTLEMSVAIRQAVFGNGATVSSPAGASIPEKPISLTFLTDSGRVQEVTMLGIPEASNPYKGLRAFEEVDAPDFFGRERVVSQIIDRLDSTKGGKRFLAVVGPSGSGKSSLVKAGVIPALREGALRGSDKWFFTQMVPGNDPFESLSSALLSVATAAPEDLSKQLTANADGLSEVVPLLVRNTPEAELCLYIDQFEEIFTLVEDETIRALFLESLFNAVVNPDSRVYIILSLRADFYDRPLLYFGFGELVRRYTEVVLPLAPNELERAITGPAERVGLKLDKSLVASIIADVKEQPGALPLLQYVLTELFERRSGDRTITLSVYHSSGGVLGALGRRAEEIYQNLQPQEQEAAQQLFLRLVNVTEGAEDTRRRILWSEVTALKKGNPSIEKVIDIFGKYRLLTFDNDPVTRAPTVEVAHEALVRRWQQLRVWLDDNREGLLLHRRLTTSVQEWLNSKKDTSFLASGLRLEQFEGWANKAVISLTPDEREYINVSLEARAAQNKAEIERKQREALLEKRSKRNLRWLAAVMFLAAIGGALLAIVAFNQRSEAQEARRVAEISAARAARSEVETRSLALATAAQLALSDDNTDLAILLALEATDSQSPPVPAQRSLFEAAYAPGTRFRMKAHTDWVRAVAFNPVNNTGLSAAQDGLVILWDLQNGTEIRRFEGHTDDVNMAVFSPDGQKVVSVSNDLSAILWDVKTAEILRRYQKESSAENPDALTAVAFHPEAATFATGSNQGMLTLWEVETGEIVREMEGHLAIITDVAYTPDGSRIVSVSADGTARVWDSETGEEVLRFEEHPQRINSVDISADGLWALTGGTSDNSTYLWELESGELIRRFVGHGDQIYSAVFTPDGRSIISCSQDASIRIWDIETGIELRRLKGHAGAVWTVAVSADGATILSGSYDNTVRLWDAKDGAEIHRLIGHSNQVDGVAFSPDGRYIVSGGWDNKLILWDRATGANIREFVGHADWVRVLAFSQDSRYVVSGSSDKTLILWDVETGEAVQTFVGHEDRVWAVAISPDNKTVLSGGQNSTVYLWEVETGERIREFEGHEGWVRGVDYSPDGRTIVSGSGGDLTIRLWDIETAEQLAVMTGHQDWVWSVKFSPDGRRLVSSASDNGIILWDVTSHQIIRRFQGHTGPVTEVSFSPDGKSILSGAQDGTVRLWDVETGTEMRRFSGHTAGVWSVDFGPDGESVLSGAGDKTIIEWRISDLNELTLWVGQNRFVRKFTCAEREQYRIVPICSPEEAALAPDL